MSFTLGELAESVGGRVRGEADRKIDAVRALDRAGSTDLSFLTHGRYREQARESAAGAILTGPGNEDLSQDLLIAENPYLALARVLERFEEGTAEPAAIHPTAAIAPGAEVAPSASVGAYAVVGDGTRVGNGARLGAHVVVGRDCRVGDDSVLHAGAVLYDRTQVGARCIVHSGAVLGADGFGYARSDAGAVKIPHRGRVVLEDDVEVGANSTIDRAMLEETRIGQGTKIDDLVMVGHNVTIGPGSTLVAQSGIAGSARLGRGVTVAAQSGAAGHLVVGDGAMIAAKSAAFKDIPAGEKQAGVPATDLGAWRRQQAIVARLPELLKRIRELEKAVGVAPRGGQEDE